MHPIKSFILATSAIFAPLAATHCTRVSLQATLDRFLSSLANPDKTATLPLAADVKIAQNNIRLDSVTETAWHNSTGFYKHFRITVLDTDICAVAAFVLVNQTAAQSCGDAASVPAILSVRIKVNAAVKDGEVEELEILNVLKGSHAFFAPEKFPNKAPERWSKPLSPCESTKSFSHDSLAAIVDTYPSGITAGDGSHIPGYSTNTDCPRVENGIKTTDKCYSGLDKFKLPVTNRRYTADSETGVVLGEFLFNQSMPGSDKNGLWLNEYFKIDAEGRLSGIYAAMKETGNPFEDVWGA